jgi:hypothetical protein
VLTRLGSRAVLAIGGTLFLLNLIIPDPIPLVDEALMLIGTILLSRWTARAEKEEEMDDVSGLKQAGRGRAQP